MAELSIEEFAARVGFKYTTVRRWVLEGALPARIAGHRKYIDERLVESFVPPAQRHSSRFAACVSGKTALPPEREDAELTGYVGETADIYERLKRRRSEPYSPRRTARQEARIIATYLTDPDMTTDDVMHMLRTSRGNVRATFAHWGADLQMRRLLPD